MGGSPGPGVPGRGLGAAGVPGVRGPSWGSPGRLPSRGGGGAAGNPLGAPLASLYVDLSHGAIKRKKKGVSRNND